MSAKKPQSSKKQRATKAAPKPAVDVNKLGVLFEALRALADSMPEEIIDHSPHITLFIEMVADRGDKLCGIERGAHG